MSEYLHSQQDNFHLHRYISDFYYMEKIEELTFLMKDFVMPPDQREVLISKIYQSAFQQWKKDSRWLNHRHSYPKADMALC